MFPRIIPFEQRFCIYTQAALGSPATFKCFHSMGLLVRKMVFHKELHIPFDIEADERDDSSFHILVFVGDAPKCYARLWLANSPLDPSVRWAVLDRVCTLKEDRNRRHAIFLLNKLMSHLIQHSNNQICALVAHVPLRSKLPIVEKLLQKGFSFVLSEEDYKRRFQGPSKGLFYFENNRIRLNAVHLYFQIPLTSSDEAQLAERRELFQRDLQHMQEAERQQIALANEEENVRRQAEILARSKEENERILQQQKQQQQRMIRRQKEQN